MSLQSTNPGLFLTTPQLRAAERDVRYIPAIASAVSRVVCRSNNKKLRNKSLELFQAIVARDEKRVGLELVSIAEQPPQARGDDSNDSVFSLAEALECQLRLAIKIKGEMNNTKKKQKRLAEKDGVGEGEEYREFDSDDETKIEAQSSQSSLGNHAHLSLSQSTSLYDVEADSENSSIGSASSWSRQDEGSDGYGETPCQRGGPRKPSQSSGENDEDIFDDWW